MNEPPPAETESPVLPPPANAAKLERLRGEVRKIRRRVRVAYYVYLFCNFGVIMAVMPYSLDAGAKAALGVLLTTGWYALIGTYRQHLSRRWRRTADAMVETAGIGAAATLIENLHSSQLKEEARAMLTALLPSLRATDAPLLNAHHHSILNRLLNNKLTRSTPAITDFVLAILKAYEQVGMAEDLPTVERLANGKGYARRNKAIREAAQACLPYLQARSEGQETRQTLLRASSGTAANPGSLLRPAQAANDANPAQLLRAANSDATE